MNSALLALVVLFGCVFAHDKLVTPTPRGDYTSNPQCGGLPVMEYLILSSFHTHSPLRRPAAIAVAGGTLRVAWGMSHSDTTNVRLSLVPAKDSPTAAEINAGVLANLKYSQGHGVDVELPANLKTGLYTLQYYWVSCCWGTWYSCTDVLIYEAGTILCNNDQDCNVDVPVNTTGLCTRETKLCTCHPGRTGQRCEEAINTNPTDPNDPNYQGSDGENAAGMIGVSFLLISLLLAVLFM